MRMLFVYPSNDPAYPIQLGALSSFVKQGGHKTQLFSPVLKDWRVPPYVTDRLGSVIYEFKPDFIAFCGYESALTWIKEFSRGIKNHFGDASPRIILGGYYPSACPHDAILLPDIDIICQGEGEQPLLELLNNPHRVNISGLWFKDSCGVPICNPVAPLISDLDTLPWPDRFHNHQELIDRDSGTIKVIAGRGCYYACTYCYAKQMWAHLPDTSKNEYVRMRSPENVIKELLHLQDRYSFTRVGFHDDIFWGGHLDWLRTFARLYKQHINKPYYCAARVEMFNDEVFDLLQESGCYLLLIGVESGDKEYRKRILRRNMTDEKIEFVVKESRRRDINVWTFNMVGMLNEPIQSMLATVALNWRLKPDFAMCSKWYPLRGTSMGDEAHRLGLVDIKRAEKVTGYARESVVRYSGLKLRFLTVARWLNILTAARRWLFWKLVWERVKAKRQSVQGRD